MWSFQTVGTKLGKILLKNLHTQMKLLNFENWVNFLAPKSWLFYDQQDLVKVCRKIFASELTYSNEIIEF